MQFLRPSFSDDWEHWCKHFHLDCVAPGDRRCVVINPFIPVTRESGFIRSSFRLSRDSKLEMKTRSNGVFFSAGVMTGLLQIFIVLAVKDTLGGSSSYQTLVSQWVFTTFLQKRFAYLAGFRCGISNWWQVRVCVVSTSLQSQNMPFISPDMVSHSKEKHHTTLLSTNPLKMLVSFFEHAVRLCR